MLLDGNCTVVALPENEVFVVNEPLLPSKVGPPNAVTAGVIAAGATAVVVPPPESPITGAPVGIAEPRFPPPPPPQAPSTSAKDRTAEEAMVCQLCISRSPPDSHRISGTLGFGREGRRCCCVSGAS